MWRRGCGILLSLLMLHLTVVAADVPCARHNHGDSSGFDHQPADHHAGMRAAMEPVAASAASVAALPDAPCETPAQPQCCRAMASCAVNVGVTGDGPVAGPTPTRAVIRPALMRLPSSNVAAPDPPPPKA